MAYYSDHHGHVNSCAITMECLQEHESKLSQRLHQLALERGIVFDDGLCILILIPMVILMLLLYVTFVVFMAIHLLIVSMVVSHPLQIVLA